MPKPSKPIVLTSASEHPAVWRFGFPIHHVETRAQWRMWLEQNHDVERGVWLGSWRSDTGKPRCPYPAVVEEAICFGWIDSTSVVLDDDRGLQLITPRKPKSSWSRLSRRRAADMEATGAMTDAGRQAIEVAKNNGWWTISDSVEDLIEPPELAAALDANPAAREHWDGFSASERKIMLWWIVSAVRSSTKEDRIVRIVEDAALGRRARE